MKTKHLFIFAILFICGNTILNANDWAKILNSGGTTNAGTYGSQIVTLTNGDIIIAGHYQSDEVIFDNHTIKSNVAASRLVSITKRKAFIAKLSNGEFVWARNVSSRAEDDNLILKLRVDNKDNIWILGTSSNPISLHGMTINRSESKQYAYIARFDSDGNCTWTKNICNYNTPEDIDFDINDHGDLVVATTVLQLERTIKQDKITYNRPGSYSSAILLRFSPAGECIWIKGGVSEGAGSASTTKGVAIDNDGNTYLTGEYMPGHNVSGRLTFNEKVLAFPPSNPKNPASGGIFIAKYDKDGICQFVSNSGTNIAITNQKPRASQIVLSEDQQKAYVIGRFSKEFNVWDNSGTQALREFKNDAQSTYFITEFDANSGDFLNISTGEARNCWVEIANFRQHKNSFYLTGNFAGNLDPVPGKRFVSTADRAVGRQKFFPFVITLSSNLEFVDCEVLQANAEMRINDFCIHNNNIVYLGTFNEGATSSNLGTLNLELTRGFHKAFIFNTRAK